MRKKQVSWIRPALAKAPVMDQARTKTEDPLLKSILEEECKLAKKIQRLKNELRVIEEKLSALITRLNTLQRAIRYYQLDKIQDNEILIAMSAAIGDYDDHDLRNSNRTQE